MSQLDQNPELIALMDEAYKKGLAPIRLALPLSPKKYAKNETLWPEPVEDKDFENNDDEKYVDICICNQVKGGLVDELAMSIANSIQFPLNTAFLHGLAVVASAMTRQFRYKYHGEESPVNLYVVTAQPPSTGKSGVNNVFSVPVRIAYEDLNKQNKVKREELERRLEGAESELKKAGNENQAQALSEQIQKLRDDIALVPHYTYSVDDATPEAIESMAFSQGGLFNIVSSESDAVNIMMGNVYSDKKTNHGMFLKGWDGEWHSSRRVTREAGSGPVFGTIAIIAQDESINTILEAGLSGRGISERILMIREKNLLGTRNHSMYCPIDPVLKSEYAKLIYNLVHAPKTVFEFSDDAMEFLNAARCMIEKDLADGGKYSHNMLRGAMGKADKQVLKIACVLHAIEAYGTLGNQSNVVSVEMVSNALTIFNQLSKTYIAAAESKGYAGEKTETMKLKEIFELRAKKNLFEFTLRSLRDAIKTSLPFSQIPNLTKQLREKILPSLSDDGYCIVHEDKVYLNPKIKK